MVTHKDHVKEYGATYRQLYKDKIRAYSRKRYYENLEKTRAYYREYMRKYRRDKSGAVLAGQQ